MQICPVTGRKHRNRRELAAELSRIDRLIKLMEAIEKQYAASWDGKNPVHDAVSDAWNAASDALDALRRERTAVEMNPRPIPAGEAGTYELVKQNID